MITTANYYQPPTCYLPGATYCLTYNYLLAILPACQVLGTNAMIMTDNNYPNTAKVASSRGHR